MPRIQPLTAETAEPAAGNILNGIQEKLGRVPNLYATLAHAPAVLGGYLQFGETLGSGTLSAQLREQIAIVVATANDCEYCLSAHTAVGQMVGVSEADTVAAQQAEASDPQAQAALRFAQAIVSREGFVTDEDLAAVRDAGYTDGQVVEILAAVIANVFTNYANHLFETEVDFPRVPVPATA